MTLIGTVKRIFEMAKHKLVVYTHGYNELLREL